MDISINSNKYAKRDDVIRMAKVMDEELEKIDERISRLEMQTELLNARAEFVEDTYQYKLDELNGIISMYDIIVDKICTPVQIKGIKKDLDMIEKLRSVYKVKQEAAESNFRKVLAEYKKKYGIGDKNNPS